MKNKKKTTHSSRTERRLRGHPALGIRDRESTLLPLRIHGDGAEFLTRDSLLTLSMTGLLGRGSTKSLTMNLASWPLSTTTKRNHHYGHDTWREVWKVLKWSFNALATGKHPSRDGHGCATPFAYAHM